MSFRLASYLRNGRVYRPFYLTPRFFRFGATTRWFCLLIAHRSEALFTMREHGLRLGNWFILLQLRLP